MKIEDGLLLWYALALGLSFTIIACIETFFWHTNAACDYFFRGTVLLLLGGIWQQVYRKDAPRIQ